MIDPAELDAVCAILRGRVSGASRWTPGEVVWSALTEPDDQSVRLYGDAFVWSAEGVVAVVAPDAATAITLLEGIGDAPVLAVVDDPILSDALARSGRVLSPAAAFDLLLECGVRDMPPPTLGHGYLVRSAVDTDDLVEIHRKSWRPSDLPYAEGHMPAFDPSATSRFTLEKLRAVQAHSLYDIDLHVVVEAPNGELAGSCITWLDSATGIASIEPLGVAPAHRRRAIASCMCRYAAQLVADRGGNKIVIHPRGDDPYPGPRGAYLRAGLGNTGRTGLFEIRHDVA